MESRFVQQQIPGGDYVAKGITPAMDRFERYLEENGYEAANECCPIDDGELVGAVDAYDVVWDFLSDSPDDERYTKELQEHATDIGQISNDWS
jgi:hypothetical protein